MIESLIEFMLSVHEATQMLGSHADIKILAGIWFAMAIPFAISSIQVKKKPAPRGATRV